MLLDAHIDEISRTLNISHKQVKAIEGAGFLFELMQNENLGNGCSGRYVQSTPKTEINIYREVPHSTGMTGTLHPRREYVTTEILKLLRLLEQ